MKTMLKINVWVRYILGLPLIIWHTICNLAQAIIRSKRELGRFDVKDNVMACLSGLVEGHRFNMYVIDEFVNDRRERMD